MIHGIFHGDLHGGNLFVRPDGRTALLDFGIAGRLYEPRRLAFLRLLMSSTANDVHRQLEAFRDLGALPPDTDIDAVISDLGLDEPIVDPTKMDADELVNEIQKTVKELLGIGARMPKELMLFIKNMVFLDDAIATLAPDLDILGEIGDISMHFATTHGERIAGELGMDPDLLRARPRGRTGELRLRAGHGGGDHLPRPAGASRDHPQPPEEEEAGLVAMPLGAGTGSVQSCNRERWRCEYEGSARYEGRLSVYLPRATRLLILKSDGSVLVHSDGGAYRPLVWMNAPNRLVERDDGWTVTNPKGERLAINFDEVLSDSRHDLGVDPGLQKDGVEAHLQELLAAACHELEGGMVLVRREHRTEIGPVDLLCRDAEGQAVAVEIKRQGGIDGVEQLARYLEFLERDPALRPVRGMFVAQVIKPQAKALAAERGIVCVEVDYDALRGVERAQTSLF